MPLQTPILFCVFNRPELTGRVFERIRAQRPRQLMVVQDGPRPGRADDAARVAAVRQIVSAVDWPCDVQWNTAEQNLGCRFRMSSGISWAFERAERLIILEDDCLPCEDFFWYCETMLDRFQDDARVLMISGDNFLPADLRTSDCYFSRYAHIWGWASWRRAWAGYHNAMRHWPTFRDGRDFGEICPDAAERAYWTQLLDAQSRGEIDSWDFPWMLTGWLQRAWTVIPPANLVSNLGFGDGATHTTDDRSPWANRPAEALDCQRVLHESRADSITRRHTADQWTWSNVFRPTDSDSTSDPRRGWPRILQRLSRIRPWFERKSA